MFEISELRMPETHIFIKVYPRKKIKYKSFLSEVLDNMFSLEFYISKDLTNICYSVDLREFVITSLC